MAVSPLDCMGCGVCVGVCPTKAISMVPQESQLEQQEVFGYMVSKVSKKAEHGGSHRQGQPVQAAAA